MSSSSPAILERICKNGIRRSIKDCSMLSPAAAARYPASIAPVLVSPSCYSRVSDPHHILCLIRLEIKHGNYDNLICAWEALGPYSLKFSLLAYISWLKGLLSHRTPVSSSIILRPPSLLFMPLAKESPSAIYDGFAGDGLADFFEKETDRITLFLLACRPKFTRSPLHGKVVPV